MGRPVRLRLRHVYVPGEDNPELARVGSEDALQRRQASLRGVATAIQKGEMSPLAVMPIHQPHKDRLDKLQAERRDLDNKWAAEDKKHGPHGYNSILRLDPQERDWVLRTLEKPLASWTEEDAKTLSKLTRQQEKSAWDRIKAAQEEQAKADAHEAALSEVRAGQVPAGTLALLGGEKKIQEALRYRTKLRDNRVADYRKLQKRLQLREKYEARWHQVASQVELYQAALHWPGRPSTMPPELLPKS